MICKDLGNKNVPWQPKNPCVNRTLKIISPAASQSYQSNNSWRLQIPRIKVGCFYVFDDVTRFMWLDKESEDHDGTLLYEGFHANHDAIEFFRYNTYYLYNVLQ